MHTDLRLNILNIVLAQSANWSTLPLQDCKPLSGGRSQQVYRLCHGREQFVLKIKTAKTSSLNLKLRDELCAQRSAANADLAPALVFSDPMQQYTVSRYLPGTTWAEHTPSTDRVRALAHLLKALHQLRPGPAQLYLQQCSEDYFGQLLLKNVSQTAVLAAVELRQSMQAVFTRIERDPLRCFCHNDLVAANILRCEDGKIRVLDWEYAATCSPYFDLATVVNELQLANNERKQLLYAYDGKVDEALLTDYCDVQRYITLLWELLTASASEARVIADINALNRKLAAWQRANHI